MSSYLHMYKIASFYRTTGGSAEQPRQVPDGRALSQPKPHPSDRLCEGVVRFPVTGRKDLLQGNS